MSWSIELPQTLKCRGQMQKRLGAAKRERRAFDSAFKVEVMLERKVLTHSTLDEDPVTTPTVA